MPFEKPTLPNEDKSDEDLEMSNEGKIHKDQTSMAMNNLEELSGFMPQSESPEQRAEGIADSYDYGTEPLIISDKSRRLEIDKKRTKNKEQNVPEVE